MSQSTEKGTEPSEPIELNEPTLPVVRYSHATDATSGSAGDAVSATVPRRNVPGSVTPPPLGAVVSIVTVKDFAAS